MKGRLRSFSSKGLAEFQRGIERACIVRQKKADDWALSLAPVVREILKNGFRGFRALASELEGRGYKTRRGGRWTPTVVGRLCRRLASLGVAPQIKSMSRYRSPQLGSRNRDGVNRNRQALRDNADDFARGMAPILASLRAHGFNSYALLADALNTRSIAPQRADAWTKGNVRHLCERLREMAARSDEHDPIATLLPEK